MPRQIVMHFGRGPKSVAELRARNEVARPVGYCRVGADGLTGHALASYQYLRVTRARFLNRRPNEQAEMARVWTESVFARAARMERERALWDSEDELRQTVARIRKRLPPEGLAPFDRVARKYGL